MMHETPPVMDIVTQTLKRDGLMPLGQFRDQDGCDGILIGNVGSSLWPAFSTSSEYSDGAPDPLNRWTHNRLNPLGDLLSCEVRYPFGETLWPFQRWAAAAMGIKQSPIGLFIHPEYGLWVALRGALMMPNLAADAPVSPRVVHPCDSCEDKPCLSSCPVDAFSASGYLLDACRSHVRSSAGTQCRTGGCRARLSCPVGQAHQYVGEQQAFHMAAFAPGNVG